MRCEFINASSCGIVVASTSIPATFVFGGLAATAPDAPSTRATRVVRRRQRRSRLLIRVTSTDRVWGRSIAGAGLAICGTNLHQSRRGLNDAGHGLGRPVREDDAPC